MARVSLITAIGALGSAFTVSVAGATTLTIDNTLDPLYGYCAVGCIDNGIITPTTQNQVTGFGFTVSPGPASGTEYLVFLVPNNELTISNIGVAGTAPGSATLLTATQWTSGTLPDFLSANDPAFLGGVASASPANPIGMYLTNGVDGPFPTTADAGATAFYVFGVKLGTETLLGNPNLNPLDSVPGGLPMGTLILGFFDEGGGNIVATANDGAILDATPFIGPTVPEPTSMVLLGTGFVAAALRRRRNRKKEPQV